jgi:hypothetical protein
MNIIMLQVYNCGNEKSKAECKGTSTSIAMEGAGGGGFFPLREYLKEMSGSVSVRLQGSNAGHGA